MLGNQSLWIDEVISLRIAMQPLPYAIKFVDPTPPIYYILLTVWNTIFSGSLLAAYLFSVICGIALVILMYFFMKRFFSERAAIIATAFTALNPALIYYSQEIRAYSFFFLIALISLWAYLKYKETPTAKSTTIYGLTAILLLYTHIYGAIIVFAQIVDFLLQHKKDIFLNSKKILKQGIVLSGTLFVLYIPWLLRLQTVFAQGSGSWIPQPDGWSLWYLLRTFVAGHIYPQAFLPLALGFLLIILIAIWIACKGEKKASSIAEQMHQEFGNDAQRIEIKRLQSILCIGLLVIFIPFILSFVVQSFFTTRYVLVSLVFLIPAISLTLNKISSRAWLISIVTIFCVCFVCATIIQANVILKDNWRSASVTIKADAQTHPVMIIPIYDSLALSYYIDNDCLAAHSGDEEVYECLARDNIYSINDVTQNGTPTTELPFVVDKFTFVTDEWINTTQGKQFFKILNQTYDFQLSRAYQLHTSNTIPQNWQSYLDSDSKFPESFNEIYLFEGVHR